jgi:tetratricopeptide (TPR) repeat protein
MSLEVANERVKRQFTPQVHLNRLKGRVAYEKHSPDGLYEYEQLLKLNRELEPNNPYLDMDEAWLLMGELWFGVSDDTKTKVNEAYGLVQNTLESDPDSPYALDLASMIERNYLNKLDKACGRLEKMIRISKDPSNMSNTANLARNCGEYDQSLGIFKKILEKAPHFRTWFKKDYAWTFLITEFEKNRNNFSEAKSYIQSQLNNNYSEDGLNEMWLIMLAYMANKEGDAESAESYVSRQSKMTNPILISWAKRRPGILDENPKFKEEFFNELAKIGISFDDEN